MSSSSQDADSPRSAVRIGEVRLTEIGETEVFDGVGWRPLASIYRDPQDGSRQSPDGPDADGPDRPHGPDGPHEPQGPAEA